MVLNERDILFRYGSEDSIKVLITFELSLYVSHVFHVRVQYKLGGQIVQIGVSRVNRSLSILSKVDLISVFSHSLQKSIGSFLIQVSNEHSHLLGSPA